VLRLEHLPREDMREVVRIATELYEKDQGQIEVARERQSLVEAAAEVDLPPAYLERAAAALHMRRVEAIRRRRRRRSTVFAVAGVLGALGGGWRLSHPPRPAPALYDFNDAPARQWVLDPNPETDASLAFESEPGHGGVASLTIRRFGARASDGTYFANLNSSDVPPRVSGYQRVSFLARSDGLPHVRLYLEAGPTERWRSPEIPLTSDWQQHVLELRQLERQTRDSTAAPWRSANYRAPRTLEKLSFKVGYFVNDVTARGKLLVDDLRFE
jgi:hypothetical protein